MYVGVDFFFPCLFQISKKHVSVSYKKSFLWGKKHTRICYPFLTFLQSVGEDPEIMICSSTYIIWQVSPNDLMHFLMSTATASAERESCRREWMCVMMGREKRNWRWWRGFICLFQQALGPTDSHVQRLFSRLSHFLSHVVSNEVTQHVSTRLSGSTWKSVAQELCEPFTQRHVKIVTHIPPHASTRTFILLFNAQASLLKLPFPAAGGLGKIWQCHQFATTRANAGHKNGWQWAQPPRL